MAGTIGSDGCQTTSRCVPKTSAFSCPVYNTPICSADQDLVAGSIAPDGCRSISRCLTKITLNPFSASPTSGSAPLNVSFTGSISGNSGYIMDFGDGSPSTIHGPLMVTCPSPGPCQQPDLTTVIETHTYTSIGTYTAILKKPISSGCDPNPPAGSVSCMSIGGSQILGSATITVSQGALVPNVCPVYIALPCPSGKHFVSSGINPSTGCEGPPQCVAN